MDGGKRSYDKPPTTVTPQPEPTANAQHPPVPPPQSEQDLTPASGGAPEQESERTPASDGALQLDSQRTVRSTRNADVGIPLPHTDVEADASTAPPAVVTDDSPRASAPSVLRVSHEWRGAPVEERRPEPISRAEKIAYGVVLGVLALSFLGLAYVHLRPHGRSPSKSASRATTTTSSAHATTTITTTQLPTALQSGPEAAAMALISSWSTQNRATALTVATPAAVTTLFAAPYTAGLAVDRGCSSSFVPIVCTFGPPGGASPTDPIYQLYVAQAPHGWYVSSVKLEN